MRFAHLAFASSLTIAAPAFAQPIDLPRGVIDVAEATLRIVLQSAISAVRSQTELTYDDIVLDLAAGRIALTGLAVRPELPWDPAGDCAAHADAVEIFYPMRFDASVGRIEVVGLNLPLACLPPDPQGAIGAAGYEVLHAPTLSVDFAYQVASSALDLTVAGTLADAIAFEADVEFAYFWVQTPGGFPGQGMGEGGIDAPSDGEPIADLSFAEISLTDIGLLDRAGPMLADMIGGFEAAPPMIEGVILQELGASGQTFAAEARSAVEAFLSGDGRIVLTVAPDSPVRLSPDLLEDPTALFAALTPRASGRTAATAALVDRALLDGALSGGALSDEDRLAVGAALAAGVGAPRAPDLARDVLAPLIDAGHPEAALIASQSFGGDAAEEAYTLALIAAAGEADGGLTRLNRLETDLEFATLSDAQNAISDAWPDDEDAVIATGDLSAISDLASRLERGVGVPRNYAAAYRLAALAAAGGDRSAAALRDRIDVRLSRRGAGSDGWAEARSEASATALSVWLDEGLLDRLAE